MPSNTLIVRKIIFSDLVVARDLLSQLGYDVEMDALSDRFERISKSNIQLLNVATLHDQVIGLVHAFIREALEKPVEVVVQAVVVDERVRKTGAGRRLMLAVEAWAKEKQVSSISLSSQIARTEAHKFYEELGFVKTATSHFMRKML